MRLDAGNAGAARPLPILVFDERRLTPSFGYVFKPQWLDPPRVDRVDPVEVRPDEWPVG
jgi:hypothetical protein